MLTNHLISGPIRGEYYLCGQELHLPEADLLVQQVAAQLHPWSQIAECWQETELNPYLAARISL